MRIVKNKKNTPDKEEKKKAVSQFCYVRKRIQTDISRNEEGYFETVKCHNADIKFINSYLLRHKNKFCNAEITEDTHNSKLILDFNTLKI